MASTTRTLALVLGDQLDKDSPLFDDWDREKDLVWMAEVTEEATHVRSHKVRIAMFLAAMRHFRRELERRDYRVRYARLDDDTEFDCFRAALTAAIEEESPERLRVVEPGEYRVEQQLREVADDCDVELEILRDTHFFCSREEFREYAGERKSLRLEYFYREMRKRSGILMDDDQPVGDQWNFDSENRDTFGADGPADLPSLPNHGIDETTQQVLNFVDRRFSDHPGSLEHFNWPVTRRQALAALRDFIEKRLPSFGQYQDALWTGEPYLYHSRLSAALNLKLISPKEVVGAAEQAYRTRQAPLNAVEGFIRQILGWREYVRGVYWLLMPEYLQRNALDAQEPLPALYWTGDTEMRCLSETIRQTLDYGYAHHIQRLMVTGLFAMLVGVNPREVHKWYLAVYIDAVEWVELPNTLGMSQFADGGVMGSKPYAATGKYLNRMSNYCKGCPFDPAEATGPDACPFTTLYWDFLARNRERLKDNHRMALQLKNLERKDAKEIDEIRSQADALRQRLRKNEPVQPG